MRVVLTSPYGAACGFILCLLISLQSIDAVKQHDAVANFTQYAAPEATPLTVATSDAVPLPACRNRFINVAAQEAYPIPHWIYSLPAEADKALILAIAKAVMAFFIYTM